MFYFLSKTAFYILMPFTWVFILVIYALFTKNQKRKRKALICCLFILFIGSNRFIVNKLMLWWEPAPIPYVSINKKYDVGVVLTGVTTQKLPNDRVFFQKGADRATHAFQLYKLGKIKKILITGGKPGIIDYGVAEAIKLKEFFLMVGVPESDIIVEDKAKNTNENALFTKEILNKNPRWHDFVIITSAFHMARSKACFKKVGLEVDIFPVDYYSYESRYSDLIPEPNIQAFNCWSLLIHEWLGLIAYKLTGKA